MTHENLLDKTSENILEVKNIPTKFENCTNDIENCSRTKNDVATTMYDKTDKWGVKSYDRDLQIPNPKLHTSDKSMDLLVKHILNGQQGTVDINSSLFMEDNGISILKQICNFVEVQPAAKAKFITGLAPNDLNVGIEEINQDPTQHYEQSQRVLTVYEENLWRVATQLPIGTELLEFVARHDNTEKLRQYINKYVYQTFQKKENEIFLHGHKNNAGTVSTRGLLQHSRPYELDLNALIQPNGFQYLLSFCFSQLSFENIQIVMSRELFYKLATFHDPHYKIFNPHEFTIAGCKVYMIDDLDDKDDNNVTTKFNVLIGSMKHAYTVLSSDTIRATVIQNPYGITTHYWSYASGVIVNEDAYVMLKINNDNDAHNDLERKLREQNVQTNDSKSNSDSDIK